MASGRCDEETDTGGGRPDVAESPADARRSSGAGNLDLLARLQMVAAGCAAAADIDELFGVALAQSSSGTGANRAVLYLIHGSRLDLVRVRHDEGADLGAWRSLPLEAELPLTVAVRNRAPAWVGTAGEREREFPELAGHRTGFVATASLPLIVQDRPIGVLGLAWQSEHVCTPAERLFLLALADQVAMAMTRLRPEAERTVRGALDWTILGDTDRQRATEALWELDEAAQAGVDRLTGLAARLCDAPVAQVSLLGDRKLIAGLVGAVCPPGEKYGPLEDSLCSVTVSLRGPLEVTDAPADARVRDLPPVSSGAVGAYLGVPMRSGDALIGALCVYDPAPRSWAPESTRTLEDLAQAVVSELELRAAGRAQRDAARRADELHRFSRTLTDAGSAGQVAAQLAGTGLDQRNAVGAVAVLWADEDGPQVIESAGFTSLGRYADRSDGAVAAGVRRMLADDGSVLLLRDAATITAAMPHLLPEMITLGVRSVIVAPLATEGRVLGGLLVACGITDISTPALNHVGQLAAAAAAAAARALLRARHAAAQARTAFLAEASLQMEESLDVAETLQRVARMAVPALADVCAIRLRGDATDRVVAVAHVNGRLEAAVRAEAPGYEALRAVAARALAAEGPVTAEAGGYALGMVTAAPLRARGRALGTLTLARTGGGTPLPLPNAGFVADLAQRAAIAIDNAMLYQQRNNAVISLQRRLLPPSLPRMSGIDLAACYETAEPDLDVGGDFYDAVVQPGGAVALVIGDVCGRGADAASITGLARHTLRTVLGDGATPGRALERLNRAMLDDGTGERFCTAAVVRVVPRGSGAELTVACAGHPLPYAVRGDGRVEEVGRPGQLLGVFPAIDVTETRVELAAGEALLLYTDGVTEARNGREMFGTGRLAGALATTVGLPAGALVERLRRTVLDYQVSGADDIAMLAMRLRGEELLRREFPATPRSAGEARRAIAALRAEGVIELPDDTADDLILAVNELVANAVVHGGAPFELSLSRLAGAVRAEVASAPATFPLPARWPAADSESGRGILLATELADRTSVWHDERTLAWVEVDVPRG